MVQILPVLDNLERAIAAPDTGAEERIREGIEITHRQFRDTLQKAGLREVGALGLQFDPHVHEAVGRVETNAHQEGEVLEVYQKGYILKDRLLRPAMVNVAQNPAGSSNRSEEGAEDKDDSSDEAEQVESDATQ
jgi:molecular chaperone GrpE